MIYVYEISEHDENYNIYEGKEGRQLFTHDLEM